MLVTCLKITAFQVYHARNLTNNLPTLLPISYLCVYSPYDAASVTVYVLCNVKMTVGEWWIVNDTEGNVPSLIEAGICREPLRNNAKMPKEIRRRYLVNTNLQTFRYSDHFGLLLLLLLLLFSLLSLLWLLLLFSLLVSLLFYYYYYCCCCCCCCCCHI